MYFPYLRGRQFELIALRELLEGKRISEKVIPIIEPVKPSSTLLKTLETFVKNDREIAVVFNPTVGDFAKKLKEMREEDSKVANELYDLLTQNDKVIKSYIMDRGILSEIKSEASKNKYLIINLNRDCLDDFLDAYEDTLPRFTLIPDDRAFRRVIPDSKVLFEDNFNKQSRNIDYIDNQDEFFSDSHLYYQNENYVGFADYLKNFLSKWKVFSVTGDDIQQIITAICSERYQDEPELFDKKVTIREFFSADTMEQQCILKTYNWDDFCYNIKHVNRFHSQQVNFDQLENLLKNMVIDIPKGTLKLFRSRICDEDSYTSGYSTRKMGVPPVALTTAGRTNSEGIQCLYLAGDEETTFHEVRARDYDHVSVGEFIQTKDLRIVDLSLFDKIGPFSIPDFDMTWFAINIEIIRKIGDEVAKPMRRFDRALDYVPTQYICDYIKHLGYDGIKFKSTLVDGGTNYAIFNEKKFECTNVKVVQIGNIDYNWSPL